MKSRVLGALAGAAVLFGGLATTASATTTVTVPGAPGAMSYFDLARKDCVGTARNTKSKVWFTVADGVLSDTYWPTVDATNVQHPPVVVTDGQSFTDLQTRAPCGRSAGARVGSGRAPQDFSFGVCATARAGPICSVPAGSVPKVMDTIPPAGVNQGTELDPTRGPVVLQGVSP